MTLGVAPVHGRHGHDGSILAAGTRRRCRTVEPGRTLRIVRSEVRMLLSFQRPPRPVGKGTPSQKAPAGRWTRGRTDEYSAVLVGARSSRSARSPNRARKHSAISATQQRVRAKSSRRRQRRPRTRPRTMSRTLVDKPQNFGHKVEEVIVLTPSAMVRGPRPAARRATRRVTARQSPCATSPQSRPRHSAISVFVRPSAATNTIRDRCPSARALGRRRVHASNRVRSSPKARSRRRGSRPGRGRAGRASPAAATRAS